MTTKVPTPFDMISKIDQTNPDITLAYGHKVRKDSPLIAGVVDSVKKDSLVDIPRSLLLRLIYALCQVIDGRRIKDEDESSDNS